MTGGQLGGTFELSPRLLCDEIGIARANRNQFPTRSRCCHFRNSPLTPLLADDGLGTSPEEDAVRENAGGFARALHGADDVQQIGVVALLLRRHAPSEALEAVLRGREAGGPGLVRERRIGHDIVVGAELVGGGKQALQQLAPAEKRQIHNQLAISIQ